MPAFSKSQEDAAASLARCVKEDSIELRQPLGKFVIKCLEPFRMLVPKAIKHSCESGTIPGKLHM